MTVGERIKEARKALRMSQSELSSASGLGRATVARYERGITLPTFSTAQKLAEVLHVKPDALVLGDGWKTETPNTIGKRIRFAREKANLTQEELAHEIGISAQSIARLEDDRISPKCDTLLRISKVLDSPVMYLILGEEG